jgi:hypothetical protein
MKTILGIEIPENIRGILYLCDFNYEKLSIEVVKEILCEKAGDALTLYAEIPNPPSQVVLDETFEGLCNQLEFLHLHMKDKKWLKQLSNQL